MKKYVFITTLLAISSLLLSGCMTTGPIVDDLDHYKKGDTYESLREKDTEDVIAIDENVEEKITEEVDQGSNNNTDTSTIENSEESGIEETEAQE